MFLIILGVLILIASVAFLTHDERFVKFKAGGRWVGFLFIVLGVITSCFVQINAGNIGVKSLFGNIQNEVLNSGLHFVNPLYVIEKLDVKTQNYTMSGVKNEGTIEGDDAIRVLTSDGLEVTIDLTVLYRVVSADAPKLLRETGNDYRDKIVRPITRTKIRDNAVYYQAVDLFGIKRDEFQQRIYKTIEEDFKKRGLMLEQLLVRNITLPNSVKASIESKINAEQDAKKMEFGAVSRFKTRRSLWHAGSALQRRRHAATVRLRNLGHLQSSGRDQALEVLDVELPRWRAYGHVLRWIHGRIKADRRIAQTRRAQPARAQLVRHRRTSWRQPQEDERHR